VSLRTRLASKAVDTAKAAVVKAKHHVASENATARLRALVDMEDDRPITIEGLLVVLVDAVHADDPRELSRRDIKKAAKRRQRMAGGLGMFGGPVGSYLARLYCEAELFCDIAVHHKLGLSDEQLAAHLLVAWNTMPDLASAVAAIDGTGQSVANRMATELRGKVSDVPVGVMTKKDAVLALWRLRALVADVAMPESATFKDVLIPGGRVRAMTRSVERQLGVVRVRRWRFDLQPRASTPGQAGASRAGQDGNGA
jgi:hypothetical protein